MEEYFYIIIIITEREPEIGTIGQFDLLKLLRAGKQGKELANVSIVIKWIQRSLFVNYVRYLEDEDFSSGSNAAIKVD